MEPIALTKRTGSGTVTVTIGQSTAMGLATVARLDNGTVLGRHCGPHHAAAGLPDGYVAAIGRLALTQQEADQIADAYRAAQDALPRDLHADRRWLVAAANAAEQGWLDERAAAMDNGTFAAYLRDRDDRARADADAAWQAVQRFDAEHPEISADMAEDRKQSVDRWMDH